MAPADTGPSDSSDRRDDRTPDTVVVVTGAAPLAPAVVAGLPADAFVIAADGGLDHARAAGLAPHLLVGDLDSVSPEGLAWAEQHATVRRYDPDKDATDTELALAAAAELAPARLVLVAGAGDRIDHALAAFGSLGAGVLDAVTVVEAWWGRDALSLARPDRPATVVRAPGTTFSVLALHGRCRGVTITGARWPLTGADLEPLVGVGVSNRVADPPVTVAVTGGLATVIVPGAQP